MAGLIAYHHYAGGHVKHRLFEIGLQKGYLHLDLAQKTTCTNPLGRVKPASSVFTKNKIKTLAFFFLFALIPAVLFGIKGYSGDDFYFHAPSWMELRDSWLGGQLWPGWASKANYTLGDPRFCFYPPFSFVLGGGLGLLLPLDLFPVCTSH